MFWSLRFRAIESGLISSSQRRMSSRQSFFAKTSGRGRDAAADLRVQPREQHEDQPRRRARRVVRRADRHELPVAEVVDEPHPQRVEQQPVALGAFAEAAGERLGRRACSRTGWPAWRSASARAPRIPAPGP